MQESSSNRTAKQCSRGIATNQFSYKIMAHHWIPHSSSSGDLPRFAVRASHSYKGRPSYVGRCYHEGDLLPANVKTDPPTAYVSWAGKSHDKSEYEVLVGPGYGWAPWQHNGVPCHAVSSGNCSRGEAIYIGRGYYNDYLIVGKIHASHSCLYIPYSDDEIRIRDYEVLVQAPYDSWQPISCLDTELPPQAVEAGNDSSGSPFYVARAMDRGTMLPTNFVPARGEAYAVNRLGAVYKKEGIEILCGPNYTWLKPHNYDIPANAIFTGRQQNGQPLIVGRACHKGTVACGLVASDGESVIIPFGGKTVRVEDYEVLIKHQP